MWSEVVPRDDSLRVSACFRFSVVDKCHGDDLDELYFTDIPVHDRLTSGKSSRRPGERPAHGTAPISQQEGSSFAVLVLHPLLALFPYYKLFLGSLFDVLDYMHRC
jgi:hypothetical protein